jgi:nitroreductase
MNEWVENRTFWEDAINARRSVRSYERRAVEPETMDKLKEFIKNLKVPFEHAVETRFFKTGERQIANNLRRPPEDCIAFIANTDLPSVAAVGFIGELASLYATGLGLSTCWFGHYMTKEVHRLLPSVPYDKTRLCGCGMASPGERKVVCILPIGYFQDKGLRLLDRLTARAMSHKRKPIGEKLRGEIAEDALNPSLRFAFDLARKAPSAANTQHWEFAASKDQERVVIQKPLGFKHIKWEFPDVCVGACAAHFWLGLNMQGLANNVSLKESDGRVAWTFLRKKDSAP